MGAVGRGQGGERKMAQEMIRGKRGQKGGRQQETFGGFETALSAGEMRGGWGHKGNKGVWHLGLGRGKRGGGGRGVSFEGNKRHLAALKLTVGAGEMGVDLGAMGRGGSGLGGGGPGRGGRGEGRRLGGGVAGRGGEGRGGEGEGEWCELWR